MTTLRDIALTVGVDVSTVSKVLQGKPIRVSPERRQQIHRVAEELHYRPNVMARGLRLKRSGAIAMPIPSLTNYVFPEIISGAQEAADQLSLVLLLLKQSSSEFGDQLISLVEHGRVDGLLFADQFPTPDYLGRLSDLGIPYVSMNRTCATERDVVALDDEEGFATQAAYLASQGHKIVAFVHVSPTSFLSDLCEKAFVETASKQGTQCPETHRLGCDFEGAGYRDLMNHILALKPRPSAVATASVVVATRLADGFRSLGVRVPEEISLIGYHDSPVAQWPPPGVTTVKMPSHLHGFQGVQALSLRISCGPFPSRLVCTAPEIVDRGSCTPPLAF